MSREVGWYPDPVIGNARRYWDGESWSAPTIKAKPSEVRPMNAGQLLVVIAGGILIAALVLWFVVQVAQA